VIATRPPDTAIRERDDAIRAWGELCGQLCVLLAQQAGRLSDREVARAFGVQPLQVRELRRAAIARGVALIGRGEGRS
jgi:acetyl-CoA carboxylase alpha subunit